MKPGLQKRSPGCWICESRESSAKEELETGIGTSPRERCMCVACSKARRVESLKAFEPKVTDMGHRTTRFDV